MNAPNCISDTIHIVLRSNSEVILRQTTNTDVYRVRILDKHLMKSINQMWTCWQTRQNSFQSNRRNILQIWHTLKTWIFLIWTLKWMKQKEQQKTVNGKNSNWSNNTINSSNQKLIQTIFLLKRKKIEPHKFMQGGWSTISILKKRQAIMDWT